ncbi:MAG: Na+/H+ antiporter subunit E [Verrucomicrobiales bacterium]|nr:Na+/H+ antiporter subunit E [Verrucomicrobiales bacterium]
MVTWIIFSGLLDGFHLALGVLSCGFVAWISGDLFFADRASSIRSRLGQACRMIGYSFWLLWQIVLANLHLLKLAFSGPGSLQPQIVRIKIGLKSDFEKFLLANSITLTPGTITMKIRGDEFFIHAISEVAVKGLDGEMERRIAAIFHSETKKIGGESSNG